MIARRRDAASARGTRRDAGPARRSRARPRDRGQLSVLLAGLFAITVLLIVGGIDVTAAHLGRVRVLDAADAAALDAADSLDEASLYGEGLPDVVPVSTQTVRRSAESYFAQRPPPPGISSWAPVAGTGSPDGREAVVVVQGVVEMPITGGLLSVLGGSVTVTVEAHARAPVRVGGDVP